MMTFSVDHLGIGHLTFDRNDQSTNLIDQAFTQAFAQTVQDIVSGTLPKGIIMRSGKSSFFAGGDLVSLSQVTDDNADAFFDQVESLKRSMRTLETLGIPLIACLNGAALGGGWELALCCHYRIALDSPTPYFGLPEVTLGLLPGGGGVTRMTRLLGLEVALPYLTEGKKFNAQSGKQAGLIHQTVASIDDLIPAAIAFIQANASSQQPWDKKGFQLPGGSPSSPALQQRISMAPAILRSKTRGNFPAPIAILSAAVEGAALDFDTASRIESRYLVKVARTPVAKAMINTFFFQLNDLQRGKLAPQGNAARVTSAAIVGAGMMGSGIAWALASKGIKTLLIDTSLNRADRGKDYVVKLVERHIQKGRLSASEGDAILANIVTADRLDGIGQSDLVIEAVIEDRTVKNRVLADIAARVSERCIIASNTSTLPISGLANAVSHPERFMGMHFFSPVEQMQLIELITGQNTSLDTQTSLYQLARQLGKLPILVRDARGFYTSRVFQAYIYEGMRMLAEGVPAAAIENAAWLAGMPMGPLAVTDNVSLTLIQQIIQQTRADHIAEGKPVIDDPAEQVLSDMIAAQHCGKAVGKGFYDYRQDPPRLTAQLETLFAQKACIPVLDIKDRLLYAQSLEALKAYEAGIATNPIEANIGALFGLGFPAWTGGPLQYIKSLGTAAFLDRCRTLALAYGDRFTPPQNLSTLD